ncbi:uncharacterized protein LOC120668650 isoform X2 [Panicum virgatum]|uniref:uncharacterized protein LOC120668650 isoform X2 n=1 Tax=Panicum virgatum TaxID=38727 RepID=UPI0019D60972|nr:uncharacterized protein LOC120668650 isoform X2 [Panicum virgatum]
MTPGTGFAVLRPPQPRRRLLACGLTMSSYSIQFGISSPFFAQVTVKPTVVLPGCYDCSRRLDSLQAGARARSSGPAAGHVSVPSEMGDGHAWEVTASVLEAICFAGTDDAPAC